MESWLLTTDMTSLYTATDHVKGIAAVNNISNKFIFITIPRFLVMIIKNVAR